MERSASATIAPAAKSLCLPRFRVALSIFVGVCWEGEGIMLSYRTAVRRPEQPERRTGDPDHAIFGGLAASEGRTYSCSGAWDYLSWAPWYLRADRTTASRVGCHHIRVPGRDDGHRHRDGSAGGDVGHGFRPEREPDDQHHDPHPRSPAEPPGLAGRRASGVGL